MPFGNISTFYLPLPGDAGTSQWGTDVRRLRDVATVTAGATDNTTLMSHGTGGATLRTADPYSTSSADGSEANFGWAITPADMGGSAAALRSFRAGNHVATFYLGHNGTTSTTATVTMYVYRVGTAGTSRVRTLLGSGSGSWGLPAVSGNALSSVTATLPAVTFQPDETIQYSFEVSCDGVALLGRNTYIFTGKTTDNVDSRIVTPGLITVVEAAGTSAGSSLAAATAGKVLNTSGTATSTATVAGTGAARAGTTGATTGTSLVAGQGSSLSGTVGTATGAATTSGQASKVLGSVGTSEVSSVGAAVTTIRPIFVFDD